MKYAKYLILSLLFLAPTEAQLLLPTEAKAQSQCAHYYMNYDTMYWQNLCNVPIIIKWRTAYGNCSGSGCGTGKFDAGSHMVTSSRRGDGNFDYWVCYYDDWVNSSCSL